MRERAFMYTMRVEKWACMLCMSESFFLEHVRELERQRAWGKRVWERLSTHVIGPTFCAGLLVHSCATANHLAHLQTVRPAVRISRQMNAMDKGVQRGCSQRGYSHYFPFMQPYPGILSSLSLYNYILTQGGRRSRWLAFTVFCYGPLLFNGRYDV